MNTAIVYASYHHQNTKRIAEAIAPVLNGTLFPVLETPDLPDLSDYNLLAIGSGIYKWRFHDTIMDYVDRLPDGNQMPVILFSTSAFVNRSFRNRIQQELRDKGYRVLGYFHAKGSADFLPEWLMGGKTKGSEKEGRPGPEELQQAVQFAQGVKETMNHD